MIPLLESHIAQAGGVSRLAVELKTAQNVVSNWRSRDSVPDGWARALEYRSELLELRQNQPNPSAERSSGAIESQAA